MLRLQPLFRWGLCVLGLAMFLTACEKDNNNLSWYELQENTADYSAEVPLAWNQLLLEIERTSTGYRPPVSARALAYIGLAAYEAGRPGVPGAATLAANYPQLELPSSEPNAVYHWPTCVNEAYAASLKLFFPQPGSQAFKDMYDTEYRFKNRFASELSQEPGVYQRSKAFGQAIAEAIYTWSTTDQVGHEAYLKNTDPTYLPNPNGSVGLWAPTPPSYGAALLPNWGRVRPFALRADELASAPPPAYSEAHSGQWYREAKEVYDVTNNLSQEQRWIAEFWSDDIPALTFTPAARWIAIANQVVEQQQADLAVALRVYAQLGLALADAGISCWHSKYLYNVERPITYIHRLINRNWQTPLFASTPPFPAYPSGHSTFGAAAAEVLTANFGDNYSMTDRCHEYRTEFIGTPRTFPSFRAMAEENALSRIYLGVHYRMDSVEGMALGRRVGQRVLDLEWY